MAPVASQATSARNTTKLSSTVKVNCKRTQEQCATFGEALSGALWGDLAIERYTDAVVYCKEGNYVNLHKAILMACPKIRKLIEPDLCCGGRCSCNQNLEVALLFPDWPERILRHALEFLYTGNLKCLDEDKAAIAEFLFDVLGVPTHLPVQTSQPLKFPCVFTAGCTQLLEADQLFQHIDETHFSDLIKMAQSTGNKSCFHCAVCKELVKVTAGDSQADINRHFDLHREEIKRTIREKTGYVPKEGPKSTKKTSPAARRPSCSSASSTTLETAPSSSRGANAANFTIVQQQPPPPSSSSKVSSSEAAAPKVAPLKIKVDRSSGALSSCVQLPPATDSPVVAEKNDMKRRHDSSEARPMKRKSKTKRRRVPVVANEDSSEDDEDADNRQTTEKKKRKGKKKVVSREFVHPDGLSEEESDRAERASLRPSPSSLDSSKSGIESASGMRTCSNSSCRRTVAASEMLRHAALHNLSLCSVKNMVPVGGRFVCNRRGCNASFATKEELGMHLLVEHNELVDKLGKIKKETLEDQFEPLVKDVGKEALQAAISSTESDEETTPRAKSSAAQISEMESKKNSSEENIDPNAQTDVEEG